MLADLGAVLVVDRDGEVRAFPSADAAVTWMEAVDVLAGEYVAFGLGGQVLDLRAVGENVLIADIGRRDLAGLRRRVRAFGALIGMDCDPSDMVAVANTLLRGEWEARWPKWPRWLSVRLHGHAPVAVSMPGAVDGHPQ